MNAMTSINSMTSTLIRPLIALTFALACSALSLPASAQSRPVTTYLYDANGNLTTITDGLGHRTAVTLDALNRPRSITQPAPATGQPTPVIQLTRDGQDQLTSLTDPLNHSTAYTLDGLGNATAQLSPDSGLTQRSFDPAGNLLSSTDARGQTTRYRYDALSRLTQVLYADSTLTVFNYDQGANGIGHLTGMSDAGISTRWTYDLNGRLTSRSQTLTSSTDTSGTAPITHNVAYSYAPGTGQLLSITYPSGKVITLRYGSSSKNLEALSLDGTLIASNLRYHLSGQITSITLGNGIVWNRSFDQDGRTTSYSLGGVPYTLSWDAANRITAITHPSDTSLNHGYSYDNLDRLTGFSSNPRDQNFSYDLNGNLLSKRDRQGPVGDPNSTDTTDTFSIDPASNRLTGLSNRGIGFTLDAAGNRTDDGRIIYAYNAAGRLSQVRITNAGVSTSINYLLNGLGQRVMKSGPSDIVPGGAQIFVYDDSWHLLGEYDSQGKPIREHVWLQDRPLAVIAYAYTADSTNGDVTNSGSAGSNTSAPVYSYCAAEGGVCSFSGTQTIAYGANGVYVTQSLSGSAGCNNGVFGDPLVNVVKACYVVTSATTIAPTVTVKYVETDQLGTPRLITDEQQRVVWSWDSAPFGDTLPNEKPANLGTFSYNLRFPGQYFDRETNLAYNVNRDYEAVTGRYVQSDPVGLLGGSNTYAYVGGNPNLWADPLGLLTGVTVWQPVGWGESSFGHVSTDINGTTYSFGPGGMAVLPTQNFAAKNDFRSGVEVMLKLTPQQEASLSSCLARTQQTYSATSNNCGSPVQNCLKEIGIDTGNQLLPVSLGNKLLDMGVTNGVKEYPTSRPNSGRSAPWAR